VLHQAIRNLSAEDPKSFTELTKATATATAHNDTAATPEGEVTDIA
jgi:hypothetical protein